MLDVEGYHGNMTWITWPMVGLILGLVAMLVFRRPLTRLLDRTRRIGKTGLEAGEQPKELSQPVGASASEELRRLFDNALLVQREDMIRGDLAKVTFRDSTDRETFLVRVLAAASIVQRFEQIYRGIWGSQLGALHFLNSANLTGVDPGQVRPWYDQAVARHPELYESYTFEQWLGFLGSQTLIVTTASGIAISLEGREFLKYLLHQGYPLYKGG